MNLLEFAQPLEQNGHKILVPGSQSWASFTGCLFGKERQRKEFDCISFDVKYYSSQQETTFTVTEDELDEDSLTSLYFGRPLRQINVSVQTKINHVDNLDAFVCEVCKIFDQAFHKDDEFVKFSKPIFVMSSITYQSVDKFTIPGYILWQLN